MSVDFERNVDKKIVMNSSRTIRRQHPHVTRTRMRYCDIFNLVIRVSQWHGTMENETINLVENLRDNKNSRKINHGSNYNVEKLGAKNL